LLMIALAFVTLALLWKNSRLGFIGAWFFVMLAPTSSFIPIATQTAAEHRMYLALVAVIVVVAFAVHSAWQWMRQRGLFATPELGAVTALVIVALSVATFRRNSDYRSAVVIWWDNVRK